MNLFVHRQSKKLILSIVDLTEIQSLMFVQTDNESHVVVVTDGVAALDMTDYICAIGVVGGEGLPTGESGGPPLAASNLNMLLAVDGLSFSGRLPCNTDEMTALIGDADRVESYFQLRFTNSSTGDDFSVLCPCSCLATAIEDATVGPTGQPTAYTKAESDAKYRQKWADFGWTAEGSDGFVYAFGGPLALGGSGKWHRLGITWVGAGNGTYGIIDQTGVDNVP
jgi:hypothetical protein